MDEHAFPRTGFAVAWLGCSLQYIFQNNHAVQQSPAQDRSPSSEMPDVFTPDYPLESESEKFYQVTMLF